MDRRDALKRHFAEAFMELCETQTLETITVGQVVERAGTARQTFYNYFSDIDDLICYAGSLPMLNRTGPFTDRAATRGLYQECLLHAAFFRQLPHHTGRHTFRAATTEWLLATYRARFVVEGLDEEERAYREACIRLYCTGSVDVFLAWCAGGLTGPVEANVRMLYDMSPAFVKEELDLMPAHIARHPR